MTAKALFTIGELARAAGVRTSTIRYYEREGILRPHARSRTNYRLYGEQDIERVRFIRAAQASGFRLADIVQLLRPASCGRVQELIDRRLDDVTARMRELRHVEKVLRGSLRECRAHERSGRCAVVERLSRVARSAGGASREGGRRP